MTTKQRKEGVVLDLLRAPREEREEPASGPRAPAALPAFEPGDAELIRRVAEGDLGPLGVLYDRYHDDVRQFVARATAGGGDADDLTHDTFLTLSTIAARYDGRPSARPFLLGIAAQLVRRRRRGLVRWARALITFADGASAASAATPEAAAVGSQEMQRFEQAMAALSEDKRLVFLLIEREGMSGEDVARALEIPVNTVWTRLHYARAELRRTLSRSDAS
jgi:RNA polymerase sigma factor (sigma-70 family)